MTNNPQYFDIHSHLTMYNPVERARVVCRMRDVAAWTISVGTDTADSRQTVEVAREFENVVACIGIHPIDGMSDTFDKATFEELGADDSVVAIGECGIDYFERGDEPLPSADNQKELFEAHVELAAENELPLMLHIRPSGTETMDAYEDALDVLEHHHQTYGEKLRGNAHFFAGDTKVAQRFLDIGFTVSFTGVITFVPAFNEVVRYVPQDMIMAETDAPFVAPEPYRGQQNEPSYVPYVVRHIAKLRKVEEDQMGTVLVNNARRSFNV
jgi:TatD DNase family protein